MKYTAFALALLILPTVGSGHHSRAYSSEEVQEWEGEIVELRWRNPHVAFTIKSLDDDGQEQLRTMEGNSIYTLQRGGITRDLFTVGSRVRVAGRQSSRRASEFYISNMLLADGRELVIVGGQPRWPTSERLGYGNWVTDEIGIEAAAEADGEGIFRVWSVPRNYSRDSQLPFTAAALAARSAWDEADNFITQCQSPGMPRPMINPHPFEFIDNGATITLLGEEFDIVRTIHMGGTVDPETQPATPLGYSVGRWESNTLVVETTQIDWPYFDGIGTPQSDAVEILERFTLNGEENRLDYRITITDPATFTGPASYELYWLALGESVEPYQCEVR